MVKLKDLLSEKCQKGYKTHPTRKTKKMFGKQYRNCVKAEEKIEEGSDTFVNILNKFGFKKGARDWGGHQFFVHKSKNLYATYNPSGRSLVIEPKRGGKALFDSDRSNFSIRALLSYLQSPKNKFVSTEGKLNERLKRFKVFVSGESKPLILMGKNEREVKELAYQMIRNSSVKVKKVVKEAGSLGGPISFGTDVGSNYIAPGRDTGVKNQGVYLQKFSSPEARSIIDGQLKMMAKELRKVQNKVIKTWMKGAKSGTIDFFDIIRGLKTGDARRAHPYETEFLVNVLTKDKIIDRFRSYFKGKKGKKR